MTGVSLVEIEELPGINIRMINFFLSSPPCLLGRQDGEASVLSHVDFVNEFIDQ